MQKCAENLYMILQMDVKPEENYSLLTERERALLIYASLFPNKPE